ncbi:ABC transporter permease [Baekduia sp.]|jgi:ABC-2 type transport system permease protein|uniref:ABC transporter permease n=1 Tax=Baekduia sp. TaxID=2600305 RepID=UPI002E02CF93|nr:ABC transporter permease [Baekduia sp.]
MSATVADVVAARVPERSWRSEWRAVKTVCNRELIRFVGNRAQIMMWLIQPLLFLFVLGSGLQSLSAASTSGVDLKTFIFPGVLCFAVTFSGMLSAASLVWDRELGFLRELTIAPVSRASILLGKCLGGAIIASSQGVILLTLAGLVGVPYDPILILGVLGLLLLLAVTVTSFGLLVAVQIKQAQTFTSIMQLFVIPMVFVSGALYPVSGLPTWLGALNRIDPLTYAVDPMRRLVFDHLDVSDAARQTLDPGVTWWGWHLPSALEAGIVLALGLAMLSVAIWRFSRTE